MVSEYEQAVFQCALESWGARAQLLMVAEEAAELGAALHRYMRGRPGSEEALLEEAADVAILLDQLPVVLGPGTAEAVQKIRDAKVRRLAIRLGLGAGGPE